MNTLVIGLSGAGKSYFTRILAQKWNKEIIYLDKHFWQPGWKTMHSGQWHETVEALCKKTDWIMDGNYFGTLELRINHADKVFFFDFSTWYCLIRVYLRTFRSIVGLEKRVDLPDDCKERFEWDFTKYILNFRKTHRPQILRVLNRHPEKEIVIFRNRKEVNEYLKKL